MGVLYVRAVWPCCDRAMAMLLWPLLTVVVWTRCTRNQPTVVAESKIGKVFECRDAEDFTEVRDNVDNLAPSLSQSPSPSVS